MNAKFWTSAENQLLLNPRMPEVDRARLAQAWQEQVDKRLRHHMGIATSGSTGESSGRLIALSQQALLLSAEAVNEFLSVTRQDVWLKTLPDFHVGGLGILARSHLSGSRVIELPTWDAIKFSELAHGATLSALVPTQIFDLVRLNVPSPKSLRAIVVGGGRFESSLRAKALALGWPVLESYGFTECGSQVATARSSSDDGLSFLKHVQVRIDATERIEVQSEALLTGHVIFRTDARGSSACFEDPKKGGWFRTEDRGQISPGGRLKIQGRDSDFIKIGGEGVLLSRLEDTLERIRSKSGSDSGDAVVLAVADERLGAVIVMITDALENTAHEWQSSFNAQVMPFERLRSIHYVEKIPRSALGKVLRADALALVGLKPLTNL